MQPKKHQGLLGWPFWTYSLAHCWRTAHKLPSLGCLFSFLSVFPANTPSSFGSLSTLCICIYPSESYQSIYPVSLLSNIYTPLAFFSLAFFSLPRVVQQRHLSVQRNADFVVCCQPAIIGKLGPLFFFAQKDLYTSYVLKSTIEGFDAGLCHASMEAYIYSYWNQVCI